MSAPTIVSDPRVMMGKPVVAGTRATVDLPSDSPLRRFELKSSTPPVAEHKARDPAEPAKSLGWQGRR